jgi:hypothetical protein
VLIAHGQLQRVLAHVVHAVDVASWTPPASCAPRGCCRTRQRPGSAPPLL